MERPTRKGTEEALAAVACKILGLVPFFLKSDAIAGKKPLKDLFLCIRGLPTASPGQTRGCLCFFLLPLVLCALVAYPYSPEYIWSETLTV